MKSSGLGSGLPSRLRAEGFPDFGAFSPARFRTGLPSKSQLLYQLSYRPVSENKLHAAERRCQEGSPRDARRRLSRVSAARAERFQRPVKAAGSGLSTGGRVRAFASSEASMKTVRVTVCIFW